MALKKPGTTNGATLPPVETVAAGVATVTATVPAVEAPKATPKAAPKQAAPKADKAGDKESYWENKEARDIETGKRIRRSGVWQAALQSMAGLQFNQGGTVESYLELVDKIAAHGLNWVNKD